MSGETAAGLALGITGSVLLVLSYIRPVAYGGAVMFDLQLLVGGIWAIYGTVEKRVSILLFGVLATVLRLWVARSPVYRAPNKGGTVILAGGGDLPSSVWRTLAESSRRKRVVVLSWAEEDDHIAKEKEAAVVKKLLWVGCLCTTDISDIESANAVWMTGGSSTRLLKTLEQNPRVKKKLLLLPSQGGVVGGTSAGAVALGARGIGLVPLEVCVHGTQHANNYCISEKTAVVISGGVMRTMGCGGLVVKMNTLN